MKMSNKSNHRFEKKYNKCKKPAQESCNANDKENKSKDEETHSLDLHQVTVVEHVSNFKAVSFRSYKLLIFESWDNIVSLHHVSY